MALAAAELADGLGGFIAAEGTFTVTFTGTPSGTPRPSFTFAVMLGAADTATVHLLRDHLGVGRVRAYPRRQEHHDDAVVFAVRAFGDLVDVVVPFMDAHLPVSHKRTQYLDWRAQLLDYDSVRRRRARGR